MNKALGAVFGLIGAILLLLPVAAMAGPILPGESLGSQIFCNGTQSASSGRFITIGGALGRAQPIRIHGTCRETLSIADTRVNITILGDGGDTIRHGNACADNQTTLIGEDPSAAQIIQVRGRNITITGIEIVGQNILDVDGTFLTKNLGLFDGIDFDSSQCPAGGSGNTTNSACNNNRAIRAQRGGIVLIGRNSTVGSFQPKLTSNTDNHNPRQYEEKTGVCIHNLSKAGIEITQSSTARIINSEIHDVGGDGVLISETSTATVGFSSGTELNLTSDPFPGQGNAGPNYIHAVLGNGVNVQRNSYGRIVGNTIIGNTGNGVAVTRGAGADVADNLLNSNSGRGIDVNDNSQVNLGTTGNTSCGLTIPGFSNIVPAELGGGTGAQTPSSAGNQCPGDGAGNQNSGTTGSGVVNLGNLVNSVTVNNSSGGIRCQRSYIAGKTTVGRSGTGTGALSANPSSSYTSCVSTLN
jgi:hypothetical protein